MYIKLAALEDSGTFPKESHTVRNTKFKIVVLCFQDIPPKLYQLSQGLCGITTQKTPI
jgi:hypothetical protein